MEEPLISFETAILAKEKGFEVQTRQYYMGSGKLFGTNIQENHNNATFTKEKYSAPRQSLLQKWLRDKHDIHAEASVHNDKTYFNMICKFSWGSCIESADANSGLKSYEEALESALLIGLSLITQ